MKRLADIISYIFHPVYMPTAGIYIVLNYGLYVTFKQPYILFITLVAFVFTCLMPVFTIFTLRLMKVVSSIHLPTKEERRIPILSSALYFYIAYYLIKSVHVIDELDFIMIAGVFTMISLSFFNFFYKLSIHMAAIGSLTGMFTLLSSLPGSHLEYFLYAAVVASGLTAFARLQLKAHSVGEVVAGYFTGFFTQYLVLWVLTTYFT